MLSTRKEEIPFIPEVREIDSEIFEGIRGFSTPSTPEIYIETVSQIPGLINKIRELKYGPKIKIRHHHRYRDEGNDPIEITTEFISGFYGKYPYSYLEQLYFIFQKSSHEHLADFFVELKRELDKFGKRNKLNAPPMNDMLQTLHTMSRLHGEINSVSFNAAKENEMVKNNIMSNLEHVVQNSELYLRDYQPDFLVSNDLSNLFASFRQPAHKIIDQLNYRLISVWLIAEAFRYPPMLFYSLLLLHLLENGYINADEVAQLHPAFNKKSHAMLGCSTRQMTDGNVLSTTVKNQKHLKLLQEKNLLILEKFYCGIRHRLDLTYGKNKTYTTSKSKITARFFKFYINYYLKLCGTSKPMSMESSFNNLIHKLETNCNLNDH